MRIDPDDIPEEVIRTIIIDCIIKERYGNTDVIREVSKHSKVRALWSLSKSANVPLFDGRPIEWNPIRRRLVYWLSFYTGIEGAYDRPPTRIVENDELLDKWLETKSQEMEQEFEKNWRQGTLKVPKSAMDHNEVFMIGDEEEGTGP